MAAPDTDLIVVNVLFEFADSKLVRLINKYEPIYYTSCSIPYEICTFIAIHETHFISPEYHPRPVMNESSFRVQFTG